MAKKRESVSPAQQAQRELSWALFVTEGYVANLAHLSAVNAYTLNARALRALRRAKEAAEKTASDLRRELGGN